MTALPTPEEVVREMPTCRITSHDRYGSKDCSECGHSLAAAIRAYGLRMLDAIDAAVRGNQTTYARPIVEVLLDLRREGGA